MKENKKLTNGTAATKYDIKSLKLSELEEVIKSMGGQSYRAKQLYEWFHVKGVRGYDEIKNLPKAFMVELEKSYPLVSLKEVQRQEDSSDGTIKYLFLLPDGQVVETVLMKYKYGHSLCISSQVGCKMGCTFCASTVNGIVRNLTASEMLDQIYAVEKDIKVPVHSVVVMGTGEPLDNYNNLIRFIELLSDTEGRNLSRRNITVSTCGIIDKINRLMKDAPQVNLAISLHASSQNERKNIMPISQKYPLNELIDACRHYANTTKRRITFEYSLIKGVNDSDNQALQLAQLLKGLMCHVNLIPINDVDEREFVASDEQQVKKFKQILEKQHIQTTLRRSLGQEIDAACGQLRNRYTE